MNCPGPHTHPGSCPSEFVTHWYSTHPDLGPVWRCDTHGHPKSYRSTALLLFSPSAENQILGITRSLERKDSWSMIGGRVEEADVTDEACIIRETQEEGDCRIINVVPVFAGKCEPDRLKPGHKEYWCTTFLGQLAADSHPHTQTEGHVGWINITQLLSASCPFRGYNWQLFSQLGLMHKMSRGELLPKS